MRTTSRSLNRPEHRPALGIVPGARTAEDVAAVVEDFHRRTGCRLMNLITIDGYAAESSVQSC
jgi:hypothetical protein